MIPTRQSLARIVICLVFVLCRHYLYEQKLARLLWKIDFRDLLMADPDSDPTSSDKLKVDLYMETRPVCTV